MNKRLVHINGKATKHSLIHLLKVSSSVLMARVVTGTTPDNRVNLGSELKDARLKTKFQKAEIKWCGIVVVIWTLWLNMDHLSINSTLESPLVAVLWKKPGRVFFCPSCLISSFSRPALVWALWWHSGWCVHLHGVFLTGCYSQFCMSLIPSEDWGPQGVILWWSVVIPPLQPHLLPPISLHAGKNFRWHLLVNIFL